jgi:hypothetical protein
MALESELFKASPIERSSDSNWRSQLSIDSQAGKTWIPEGGTLRNAGFASDDMLLAQLNPQEASDANAGFTAADLIQSGGALTDAQQDALAKRLSYEYNALPPEKQIEFGRTQQDIVIAGINKELKENGSTLSLETDGDTTFNTGRRGSLRSIVIKDGNREVSSFTFNSRSGDVDR